MAINLVRVDAGVRTVLNGRPFADERAAGVAAADLLLGGGDRDYDTLEIEDTVAATSKVVAVRPAPVRVIQTTDGDWVQIKGRAFATQAAAEADAVIRSRPKLVSGRLSNG